MPKFPYMAVSGAEPREDCIPGIIVAVGMPPGDITPCGKERKAPACCSIAMEGLVGDTVVPVDTVADILGGAAVRGVVDDEVRWRFLGVSSSSSRYSPSSSSPSSSGSYSKSSGNTFFFRTRLPSADGGVSITL
jgi:hypothetical protein